MITYALAVEKLFLLGGLPTPVDFIDDTNWAKTIIYSLKREENLVCQRKQLDNTIHAQITNQSSKASVKLREAAVVDVVSNGKATG